MSFSFVSISKINTYKIIHECYDNDSTKPIDCLFNLELDEAVRCKYDIVIIEPKLLANRTLTWLNLAKYLRRFANLFGICCITSSTFVVDDHVCMFFGSLNVCTGLFYYLCWNSDPCISYRPCFSNSSQYIAIQSEYRNYIRTNKPVILLKNNYFNFSHFVNCSLFTTSLAIVTYKIFKIRFN